MMTAKTIKMMVRAGRADEAYQLRVGELVRSRYSINDEMALLRQRDEKVEEFAEYNAFAEECKAAAHAEVYGE